MRHRPQGKEVIRCRFFPQLTRFDVPDSHAFVEAGCSRHLVAAYQPAPAPRGVALEVFLP